MSKYLWQLPTPMVVLSLITEQLDFEQLQFVGFIEQAAITEQLDFEQLQFVRFIEQAVL